MNKSTLPHPDFLDGMYDERFASGTPRSNPYREGFRRGLRYAIAKANELPVEESRNPYFHGEGSAEADAWWAGFDDGKAHRAFAQQRWDDQKRAAPQQANMQPTSWSPATGIDGHTQCRFCGEYVRDNGAADTHMCRGDER
ncbi:hypothetical protein [Massilia aerilata]|uniref:Uncharacterized protein n=1 Tax=Massilia aerilata TaxID=453817 RepID=A0ABW0S043_9BURK